MRKPAIAKLLAIWTIPLLIELMGIHTHYTSTYITPSPHIASNFNVIAIEPEIPQIKSEKQEIIEYIVEVFSEDAPDAFMVLSCENKQLRPDATNHNSNGSIDEGIFQVNSIHGQEDMKDWHKNIDYAYKIFDRQGWSPWSCSHKVGVTPFYLR